MKKTVLCALCAMVGGWCSADVWTFGPEKSLTEIRDAVRAYRSGKVEGWKGGMVEVVLRDGVYHVDRSLELTAEDSGTESAPVIWCAEHPGKAVLTAATALEWNDAGDGLLMADIPGADPLPGFLNGAIMHGFANLVDTPCFLVQDGARLPLARYPNEGYLRIGDYVGGIVYTNVLGGSFIAHKDAAFRTGEPPERMAKWAAERDLWVYGFWWSDWADACLRVTNVNVAANTIKVCEQYPYRFRENRRYSIRNAVSEIDEPGEWALDRANRRLTLKPRGTEQAKLVLHETILRARGLHDVDFRGIAFECTRKDALAFSGCERVNVRGCTVRLTGGWGVRFAKSRRCRVEGCEMSELGEGGVWLEGGDPYSLAPGENVADNNHIHHYGKVIANYRPGVSLNGVGNRATHNLIHHTEHQGLNFNGNDHYLGYNILHDLCMHNDDAGSIYCCQRDWTKRGTVVEHNLVYFTGQKPKPTNCHAVYLDDSSSGTTVRGNILVRASTGVSMGGGHTTLVHSNVIVRMVTTPVNFASRGPGSFADNRKPTGIRAGYKAPNFQRLDAMKPFIARYPEKWAYPHLLDEYVVRPPAGDTTEPGFWAHHQLWSEIVGNLFVCSAPFERTYFDKMAAYNTFADNATDAGDPGFADYERLDFSAKAGGPHEALIRYCDFPRMGLYESPWRAGPVIRYGEGVTPAPHLRESDVGNETDPKLQIFPHAHAAVTVFLTNEVGRIKPMNAVGNGPVMGRPDGDSSEANGNGDLFRALEIPYCRTHDSNSCMIYGSPYIVDITAVFPDFDADENDPASYRFKCTDAFLGNMLKVGSKPFYRLGQTFNFTKDKSSVQPPKDFAKWARICEHIVKHYNAGWTARPSRRPTPTRIEPSGLMPAGRSPVAAFRSSGRSSHIRLSAAGRTSLGLALQAPQKPYVRF